MTPVVVVTHNNTVGASIKPNYIFYTHKKIENDNIEYQVYTGFPSDKYLKDLSGNTIENFEVLINCLEAGELAYNERGNGYEILKN